VRQPPSSQACRSSISSISRRPCRPNSSLAPIGVDHCCPRRST
jgi:hypothetical protein